MRDIFAKIFYKQKLITTTADLQPFTFVENEYGCQSLSITKVFTTLDEMLSMTSYEYSWWIYEGKTLRYTGIVNTYNYNPLTKIGKIKLVGFASLLRNKFYHPSTGQRVSNINTNPADNMKMLDVLARLSLETGYSFSGANGVQNPVVDFFISSNGKVEYRDLLEDYRTSERGRRIYLTPEKTLYTKNSLTTTQTFYDYVNRYKIDLGKVSNINFNQDVINSFDNFTETSGDQHYRYSVGGTWNDTINPQNEYFSGGNAMLTKITATSTQRITGFSISATRNGHSNSSGALPKRVLFYQDSGGQVGTRITDLDLTFDQGIVSGNRHTFFFGTSGVYFGGSVSISEADWSLYSGPQSLDNWNYGSTWGSGSGDVARTFFPISFLEPYNVVSGQSYWVGLECSNSGWNWIGTSGTQSGCARTSDDLAGTPTFTYSYRALNIILEPEKRFLGYTKHEALQSGNVQKKMENEYKTNFAVDIEIKPQYYYQYSNLTTLDNILLNVENKEYEFEIKEKQLDIFSKVVRFKCEGANTNLFDNLTSGVRNYTDIHGYDFTKIVPVSI